MSGGGDAGKNIALTKIAEQTVFYVFAEHAKRQIVGMALGAGVPVMLRMARYVQWS